LEERCACLARKAAKEAKCAGKISPASQHQHKRCNMVEGPCRPRAIEAPHSASRRRHEAPSSLGGKQCQHCVTCDEGRAEGKGARGRPQQTVMTRGRRTVKGEGGNKMGCCLFGQRALVRGEIEMLGADEGPRTRAAAFSQSLSKEKKVNRGKFEKKEREISSLSQESEREKRERVCRR